MNMPLNHKEFKPTRRALLRTAPAAGLAAMMAGAVPASQADDPMCEWVNEWKRLHKLQCDLSYLPGGGDFELPEQIAASDQSEELAARISRTEARTPAGVAAQLEWLDEDTDGFQCFCDLNIAALRNAISALRGGSV